MNHSLQSTFVAARRASVSLAIACLLGSTAPADEIPQTLWAIGKPDRDDAEFALAPAGYRGFREDGFFVVGQSTAARDWPYVQPGPGDAWAGGRAHTFTVLFGLKTVPAAGLCRLRFDLLDTHSQNPPQVRIQINGHAFEQTLPKGGSDDSVNGQPAKGRPHQFAIPFAANLLRAGDNAIQITTLTGSWFLYDALTLETPPGAELAPVSSQTLVDDARPIPALVERDGQLFQPVRVSVRHFGAEAEATIRVGTLAAQPLKLSGRSPSLEVNVPAVDRETPVEVSVEVGGKTLATRQVNLKPVRKVQIYVLPHSHTDIGYTEIQTAIEHKQVTNLLQGIEYARKTAGYPEGARFVWNVEVAWAADLYLQRLSEAQRADFFEAVKRGQVALNGMYLNELTGLCRPEELLRLFRFSTQLAERCGVTVDSAMISDVPGYTWGTVTAMAQAGIRYFSTAPNYFDRIGDIMVQWENKPFYWVSPSGREKVLVWIPFKGYAMSHLYGELSPRLVEDFQAELEKKAYPYDIAYMRWSGHGDNAVPDPAICEFIRDWNAKYAWPKFTIASTSEAFRQFEARYGPQLPVVRGDWTPYWEDGAGSSAAETALNRASAERLTQAETLWALCHPTGYPTNAFEDAWRNTLLYSEHTWGAWCSVSDPENKMTQEQWAIKQSYALKADKQSRELLNRALPTAPATASGIDVFNTTSWPRTELVTLSKELSAAGDRVEDDQGRAAASQRLRSGELVFVARAVPPFAARRYSVSAGNASADGQATAEGTVLDNGLVHVRVDPTTGAIVELRAEGINANLVDTTSGHAVNDYLYLPGDNLANLERNGPVKITVKENGPLVASLLIESAAPGCNQLTREVRLVAGFDHVELINTVDKQRAAISPKPGDGAFAQRGGKESVNFAFPFNVPDGDLWLDVPLGAIRPELDQMPSACKNWFTVGRWADVANADHGVEWVTLDAPLVEVGAITANLLGSQTNPQVWRKHVNRTQTFYSWAMNNHWGTNYRAYQEGPVVFRFVLRPHRRRDPAEAARFASGWSQPLVSRPARGPAPPSQPLLRVEPNDVLVIALKPSDDGRALIVRLFGASGENRDVKLTWPDAAPRTTWLSDTSEKPLRPAPQTLSVPGWEVVTLRVDQP